VGAILLVGALSALWVVIRCRRNDRSAPTGPETGEATAPSDKTPGPNPGSGTGPAEMPTPAVPPRPAASELPVGPWVVRPELQGDATPAGYSQASSRSVSPPGTPASLASVSLVSPISPGWQGWGQGWGAGIAPLSPVAEGAELDYQLAHQAPGQHQDERAAPTGEGTKTSQGDAVELPA
jgi:hypothetical protein